jgi:hypothetical protein
MYWDHKVRVIFDKRESDEQIPEGATEFVRWLQGKIALAPEECRDELRVHIDAEDDYGLSILRFVIYYRVK